MSKSKTDDLNTFKFENMSDCKWILPDLETGNESKEKRGRKII